MFVVVEKMSLQTAKMKIIAFLEIKLSKLFNPKKLFSDDGALKIVKILKVFVHIKQKVCQET